jgi:CRISPR-associated protein Cas2
VKIKHGAKRDFLVTYDICCPRRLRLVHKLMLGHGQPIQYSVFRCFLTPTRKVSLMSRLLEIIHCYEDQVILFELGSADTAMTRPIEVLGVSMPEPYQGPQVY